MNAFPQFTKSMRCAVLMISLCASGCNAYEVPAGWKTDCVGRMELSLPAEVEVAADTLKSWHKYSSPHVGRFVDEQVAGWSSYSMLGDIQVSHTWAQADIDAFMHESSQARDKFRPGGSVQKMVGAKPFQELSTEPQKGIAWDFGSTRYAVFQIGNHVLGWTAGVSANSSTSSLQNDYLLIVNGLRERATFLSPGEPGVCLPYAFIHDDGKARRYIATTYRLREHPDVTVLLKDVTAAKIDPKANQAVYDPESISNSFWSQYDSSYRKSLRSVWNTPYKKATLANSKGVESFVKIVRNDDAVDYGYLVATRGDPHAKEDTPDLMLYVIQDSKNAKAKGITPMEKDAFLEMAQTIAASVKRRPVEPR